MIISKLLKNVYKLSASVTVVTTSYLKKNMHFLEIISLVKALGVISEKWHVRTQTWTCNANNLPSYSNVCKTIHTENNFKYPKNQFT